MTLDFRQHNKSSSRPPLQPRAPIVVQPPQASFSIPPSKSNNFGMHPYKPNNFSIHPSKPNSFVPPPPIATLTVEDDRGGEVVNVPDFRDDNTFMSAGEAEKALRDLIGGGMNQELDADVEIDMSQATVEGFKPEFRLLPHQVLGRAWMKDREDVSKKRTGGILADDMGYSISNFTISIFLIYSDSLGKTIQTLARIVDGRARKSDKADGWSASTL